MGQAKVVKTNLGGLKTECLLANGIPILVSNFLTSFIRTGDELLFPLGREAADAGTEIYIRKAHPDARRWDFFQAEISEPWDSGDGSGANQSPGGACTRPGPAPFCGVREMHPP